MPRLDFAYAGIKFKSSYFNMVLKGDYKKGYDLLEKRFGKI